jgi:hypothetical protein
MLSDDCDFYLFTDIPQVLYQVRLMTYSSCFTSPQASSLNSKYDIRLRLPITKTEIKSMNFLCTFHDKE